MNMHNNNSLRARRPLKRRGSFLIFVVAVLALLSVIIISYVGIGSGDRRQAAALVQQREADTTPEAARDYIRSVIAADKLMVEPVERNSSLLMRELTDYPSTREDVVAPLPDEANPSITGDPFFEPAGSDMTDPWLASTEPVFLGADASGEPLQNFDVDDAWRLRRDWKQVSNFSPTGLFANLANLRDNFSVTPGIEERDPDTGKPQLNYGVTLLQLDDIGTGYFESFGVRAPNPRVFGVGNAELDRPAHWATNQHGAFRPMIEPGLFDAADHEHILNQWADADGDGFADSRWIELTSPVLDPRNPNRFAENSYATLVPETDGLRYFWAIRAVDLSAMVNVATARDQMGDPSEDYPIGASPADVDLLRLLTLGDYPSAYQAPEGGIQGGTGGPMSYASLIQPVDDDDPENYLAINGDPRDIARDMGVTGYSNFRLGPLVELQSGGSPEPLNYTPISNPTTQAYLEPLTALERFAYYDRLLGARFGAEIWLPGNSTPYSVVPESPDIASLLELLTYRGVNDPSVNSPLEVAIDNRLSPDISDNEWGRYGPLRSGRSLGLERNQRAILNADLAPLEGAMVHSFIDPRQRLTTLSGNRPLRPVAFEASTAPAPLGSQVPTLSDQGQLLPIEDFELAYDPATVLEGLDSPNGTRREEALARLFAAYADALLPYADRTAFDYELTNRTEYDQRRTLHYGHRGAEAALHMAAHMTANMADLYDENTDQNDVEEPTVFTLIVDANDRQGRRTDLLKRSSPVDWNNIENLINQDPAMAWAVAEDVSGTARPFVMDLNELSDPNGNFGKLAGGAAERLADTTTGSDTPSTDVVQIFGIEPQPILTEVATFTIYTDEPDDIDASDDISDYDTDVGGDVEGIDGTQNITINGDISATNGDFVAQVVAFQVHNPFDEDIKLYRNVDGKLVPRFYAEFAGRTYALAEIPYNQNGNPRFWPLWDSTNDFQSLASAGGITELDAGETRVFYALGEDPDDVASRVGDLLRTANTNVTGMFADADEIRFDVSLLSGPNQFEEAWPLLIESQLEITDGITTRSPVLMPEINAEAVERRSNTGVGTEEPDIFRYPQGTFAYADAPAKAEDVAMLWRMVLTPGEADRVGGGGGGGGGGTLPLSLAVNMRQNDQLIDRLRAPTAGGLRRTLPAGSQSISGTEAYPTFTQSKFNSSEWSISRELDENDNLGFTLMLWSSVRRPSGGGGLGDSVESYMVERKFVAGNSLNADDTNTGITSLASLDRSDFEEPTAATPITSDGNKGFVTFARFVETMLTDPDEDVLDTIDEEPDDKTGNAVNDADYLGLNNAPFPSTTPRFQDQLFRMYEGNERFEVNSTDDRVLRPADLLAAMPVGPRFDPGAIDDPQDQAAVGTAGGIGLLTAYDQDARIDALERAWVTLPEAIALALGYSDDVHGRGPQPESTTITPPTGLGGSSFGLSTDPLTLVGAEYQGNGRRSNRLLHRGKLRPEAFVPFLDLNRNGVRNYVPPNPLSPVPPSNEPVVGAGIPLAATIFENLSPMAAYGGIDRAVPGRININTAVTEVLRSLPMFAPASGNALGGTVAGLSSGAVIDVADGATAGDHAFTDIAATATAYRDLLPVATRSGRFGEYITDYFLPSGLVGAARDRTSAIAFGNADPRYPDAFRGIREREGFASIGELYAARVLDASNRSELYSIDRLGNDNQQIARGGFEFFGGDTNSNITDDLDEQLAILNAAANSVTVGSDLFAVWILMHGYAPGDVEGLEPEDVMTPSVARRFLLVLDRSNVVNPGDLPEIVLFIERPL